MAYFALAVGVSKSPIALINCRNYWLLAGYIVHLLGSSGDGALMGRKCEAQLL
jgi:hypothetical protein